MNAPLGLSASSSPSQRELMEEPAGSSETRMPVMAPSMFPGFKFSPSDVELITYYLKNKLEGLEKSVEIIPEVEISRNEPWDLPGQSIVQSENEWFFFSARGRKYPNGLQSKRATAHGYWKATGKERKIKSGSAVVGTTRTLMFHIGRAPKGERTEWIIHEFCMEGRSQELVLCRLRKNRGFRASPRRTPVAQGHSSVDNEIHARSEGCMEQASYSEKEKAFDLCDSHSVENVDSKSENERNLSNRSTLAGLSMLGKGDTDEGWFSDILNDEIVKLDESFAAPELLPVRSGRYEPVPADATRTRYVPEPTHLHPVQAAEQAPPERYMRFLDQPSEYKQSCVAEHLSLLRSMSLWQPRFVLCVSLLVLFVGFLVSGKPFKMLLDLFASGRTCKDHS